jgi:6-phosphogluconolactonase
VIEPIAFRLSRREVLGGLLAVCASATARASARLQRVFVGTFAHLPPGLSPEVPAAAPSQGIYGFELDAILGHAGPVALAAPTVSPGNLILHSNHRVLYACGAADTAVAGDCLLSAFAIEADHLRPLNSVRSGGSGPSHGVVDRRGRNLLTVNFSSGSLVCFALQPDGALGPRTALIGPGPITAPAAAPAPALAPAADPLARPAQAGREGRNKPHCVVLSPDEAFAIVAEIDADRCVVYRFNADEGTLAEHSAAASDPGAGPRHLAFHPDGRTLYSSNETGSSVSAWRWERRLGRLSLLQTLATTPAAESAGNHPAHVAVHPSGRFVYVSNRGHGSIAVFRVRSEGRLETLPEVPLRSATCMCFAIDGSGRWLVAALETSAEVRLFGIDEKTGRLSDTGQSVAVSVPSCIQIA